MAYRDDPDSHEPKSRATSAFSLVMSALILAIAVLGIIYYGSHGGGSRDVDTTSTTGGVERDAAPTVASPAQPDRVPATPSAPATTPYSP